MWVDHQMTKDEQKLIDDFRTVTDGLNAIAKRANALGIEVSVLPYGSYSEVRNDRFEFKLTRDHRDFEVTLGEPVRLGRDKG